MFSALLHGAKHMLLRAFALHAQLTFLYKYVHIWK